MCFPVPSLFFFLILVYSQACTYLKMKNVHLWLSVSTSLGLRPTTDDTSIIRRPFDLGVTTSLHHFPAYISVTNPSRLRIACVTELAISGGTSHTERR